MPCPAPIDCQSLMMQLTVIYHWTTACITTPDALWRRSWRYHLKTRRQSQFIEERFTSHRDVLLRIPSSEGLNTENQKLTNTARRVALCIVESSDKFFYPTWLAMGTYIQQRLSLCTESCEHAECPAQYPPRNLHKTKLNGVQKQRTWRMDVKSILIELGQTTSQCSTHLN